jgi:hypothetical protein
MLYRCRHNCAKKSFVTLANDCGYADSGIITPKKSFITPVPGRGGLTAGLNPTTTPFRFKVTQNRVPLAPRLLVENHLAERHLVDTDSWSTVKV